MLPSPFLLSSKQRQKRSLTQDVIPFLHNLIFQYLNPLSFETEIIVYTQYFKYENIMILIYITFVIKHLELLNHKYLFKSFLTQLTI